MNTLNFQSVTLQDKASIDRFLYPYGENSCQHSFTQMFALSEKYGDQFCICDDMIYFLRSMLGDETYRVYLSPMGSGDLKQAYLNVLEDAHRHGRKVKFMTLTESKAEFVRTAFPNLFEITEEPDYFEYVYDNRVISEYAGSQMHSNRRHARNVWKTYGGRMSVHRITPEDLPEIDRLDREWIEENREDHDEFALRRERREMQIHLQNYDALGMDGVVVRIDGEIQGFVYGAPLSHECYDFIVEKANRSVRNLGRVLNQELARLTPDFPLSNWEETVGVEGLRHFKELYHPVQIIKKYKVVEA